MPPLKVYIVDDHPAVRLGMRKFLQSLCRIGTVKEAENGTDLIELVKEASPDIVILDLEMPGMNGFETSRYLIKHHPLVKILILTMHVEEILIMMLIEAGVHGFLTKKASLEEIEKAIYSIADRDFYRNELVDAVLRRNAHKQKNRISDTLTAREIEVLIMICQELTPSEISDRLLISEKTFFNHRTKIIAKIGAKSNVGLLKYAYQEKIIDLPSNG